VPRAHDIFRAYEGMEGRKNKNLEKLILNTIQDFKNTFLKPKFHYKPTCEMGSV
jgi:hypothetical protein